MATTAHKMNAYFNNYNTQEIQLNILLPLAFIDLVSTLCYFSTTLAILWHLCHPYKSHASPLLDIFCPILPSSLVLSTSSSTYLHLFQVLVTFTSLALTPSIIMAQNFM